MYMYMKRDVTHEAAKLHTVTTFCKFEIRGKNRVRSSTESSQVKSIHKHPTTIRKPIECAPEASIDLT